MSFSKKVIDMAITNSQQLCILTLSSKNWRNIYKHSDA